MIAVLVSLRRTVSVRVRTWAATRDTFASERPTFLRPRRPSPRRTSRETRRASMYTHVLIEHRHPNLGAAPRGPRRKSRKPPRLRHEPDGAGPGGPGPPDRTRRAFPAARAPRPRPQT